MRFHIPKNATSGILSRINLSDSAELNLREKSVPRRLILRAVEIFGERSASRDWRNQRPAAIKRGASLLTPGICAPRPFRSGALSRKSRCARRGKLNRDPRIRPHYDAGPKVGAHPIMRRVARNSAVRPAAIKYRGPPLSSLAWMRASMHPGQRSLDSREAEDATAAFLAGPGRTELALPDQGAIGNIDFLLLEEWAATFPLAILMHEVTRATVWISLNLGYLCSGYWLFSLDCGNVRKCSFVITYMFII